MMKHKLFMLLLVFSVFLLGTNSTYAQCDAATMTITTTVTPNSCGDNGQVVVTTNATNPTFTLTALAGTFVAGPQSSNTFQNLAPGDYQLTVECDNGGSSSASITVGNTASPITDATVTSTSSCGAGSFNGSFSITGITGGSSPYWVSAILSNDVDYDDSLSNYGAPTSTFPITYNITTPGTYQIRIKDACGTYYTVTQTLQASTPQVTGLWWGAQKVSCAVGSTPLTFTGFSITTASGVLDNVAQVYGRMKMTVYEQTSGVVCNDPTTAPATAPLFSAILTDPATTDQEYNMAPSHKYFVIFEDECGQKSSVCFDNTYAETTMADVIAKSSGCSGAAGSGVIFEGLDLQFMKMPVKVEFLTSTGTLINPQPQIEYNADTPYWDLANNYLVNTWDGQSWQTKTPLPFANYIVRFTDNCGQVHQETVSNPIADLGTTPVTIAQVNYWEKWRCENNNPLNQQGTAQIGLTFNGPVQDIDHLIVTIVNPSPSHIGDTGFYKDGRFWFTNLLPGNYTIQLNSPTACAGYPITLTFTVDANNDVLLTQRINSWGESFCSGGGNIKSSIVNNSGYSGAVVLFDANGNFVATSGDGNFYNLPAGTYRTVLRTNQWCTTPSHYDIPGSEVVLTANAKGPRILRRNGIICDPPAATGTLYVDLAGPLPITFKYKVTGSTTWTSITVTDLSQSLVISGLLANTSYDLLATACGKTTTSSVYMATANPLAIDNTKQPCPGQPYAVSVRKFAGATYSWTYNGTPYGGTSNVLSFSPYTAANDGMYTVSVNWGGCTVRTYTFVLDSTKCGQSFGTGNASGNVFNDTTQSNNTVNGTGIGAADGTQLYITAVPVDGSAPRTVAVNADGTYSFANLPWGTYNLILSTNSAGATTPNLPTDWSNIGENLGTGIGTDGIADGSLTISFGTAAGVTNANFGIAKTVCYKPFANLGSPQDTKHGITALNRAGTDNGGWPMIRKGAWTALEANTKGFVINRLDSNQISAISNPVDGMMVYDTDAKCLKIYVENTTDSSLSAWSCFNVPSCPDNN